VALCRAAISAVSRTAPTLVSSPKGTGCFVPSAAAPAWRLALRRSGIKSYSDVGAVTGLRFCPYELAREAGQQLARAEEAAAVSPMPKSLIRKRSIVFNGQKTTLSLEDEFWNALKEIAAKRGMHMSQLLAEIDGRREHANLSSAIRLFVLDCYRQARGRQGR
jgi:predicted DNA-binding ribbon-helix-helix protein